MGKDMGCVGETKVRCGGVKKCGGGVGKGLEVWGSVLGVGELRRDVGKGMGGVGKGMGGVGKCGGVKKCGKVYGVNIKAGRFWKSV